MADQPSTYYVRCLGASSVKYGPCEVCGEHVSEMWIRSNGSNDQVFGHRECLEKAPSPSEPHARQP
ncbi:MAG: hypothetical protein ABFE07_11215 [Armatimonadia bacterium]